MGSAHPCPWGCGNVWDPCAPAALHSQHPGDEGDDEEETYKRRFPSSSSWLQRCHSEVPLFAWSVGAATPVQSKILFPCILTAGETQPTLVVAATVFPLRSQTASNMKLWLQDVLFAFLTSAGLSDPSWSEENWRDKKSWWPWADHEGMIWGEFTVLLQFSFP